MYKTFDFAIVGGGISGVSAIEQISLRLPHSSILLMTSSSFVKVATTRLKLSSHIEELDIQQKSVDDFHSKYPNLTVVTAKLESIRPLSHYLVDSLGQKFGYKKLCLCTGANPKLLHFDSPHIIGLRDTDSAINLKEKLATSKKVCIVGNGGIATELIYELKNVEVVWIIRDKYIASTFVDAGAAEFLMNCVGSDKDAVKPATTLRYTISSSSSTTGSAKSDIPGCALGPNWHNNLLLVGGSVSDKTITVEYQSEIESINEIKPKLDDLAEEWPVYVTLASGKVFGCDIVISATGVCPAVPSLKEGMSFKLGEDGGILVNESMQSSIEDIYAAGDCCTVNWEVAFHWLQMRLWTQARPMGGYAGLCMVSSLSEQDPPLLDFSFELFTHVTRFFGFKVVLLGLFNGQKLDGKYEAIVRVTKGIEYLKLVVQDGKLHGAVLIGDTDMEETFENLILNQLDITRFGENLLNPDIDIEDYFD